MKCEKLLSASASERGFTLVELLVAMGLSLLVAMAAMGTIVWARQGFFTTDASADLRDSGRFADAMLRRLIVQAGYLDDEYAMGQGVNALFNTGATPGEPNIKGFTNATFNQPLVIGTTNTVPKSSAGYNGSDLLIIRFQGNRAYSNDPSSTSSSSTIDQAVIDCLGTPAPHPANSNDMTPNALYVANNASSGEPTLYCQRPDPIQGTWKTVIPLVDGVESFKVMYGVDKVAAGAAPSGITTSLTEQYLRADQLIVKGNDAATNKNWQRVRSVRIGMVIRSRPGAGASAPKESSNTTQKLYPLGEAFASSSNTGSSYIPDSDGRYRQTVTFTVHLRNTAS